MTQRKGISNSTNKLLLPYLHTGFCRWSLQPFSIIMIGSSKCEISMRQDQWFINTGDIIASKSRANMGSVVCLKGELLLWDCNPISLITQTKWDYSMIYYWMSLKCTRCVNPMRIIGDWWMEGGLEKVKVCCSIRSEADLDTVFSDSGHHLWLSLPLQTQCVKQHLEWNPSHHESPAAHPQTDGDLSWTTP